MKSMFYMHVGYVLLFIFCASAKRDSIDVTETSIDFQTLITEILLNTLRPHKCLTIVTDYVYYEIFKASLYRQFGVYISYFMILVKDSEDLLSPCKETQRALYTAKKHDCQTYIILIANGIQLSRLLRFGDRYRVLDTRANFILLYDVRLFEKKLHYLWKRIVNVIFIREYKGVRRFEKVRKYVPWFEITTVPFPAPIQGVLVPKRLDIWRSSKFRTGTDLFRDKTSDLRNQTMRIVTFKHTPATTKISLPEENVARTVMRAGQQFFTGLEIEILATVARAMNFKCRLYEPANSDIELWGRKQAGNQFSGLYGEMVNDNADIALGDLYYVSYILDIMDLTVPYNTECLTFLTPESLTDNSWKTLILPFKAVMWAMVLTCLVLCGVIFYGLAKFHHKFSSTNIKITNHRIHINKKRVITMPIAITDRLNPHIKYALMKEQIKPKTNKRTGLYIFGEMFNSMLYTCSMLLMVSLPKLPTGWSLRIVTGCYWIYCTLVVVSYRASMTAILANPASRVTIDTLQELVDSSLACGGWGEINRELFKTSLDPTSQIIGSKFEFVNDSDEAIERVAQGTFAFYENIFFLKEASVKRQMLLQMLNASEMQTVNRRDERNLHIMKDCVINMPISIGLQKNSPIKPRVDKYIRRVLEAGLIKKWLDDVMEPTISNEKPLAPESTKALMDMKKFIGAIVALFIGYFFSIVALIIEMCYFKYIFSKHPHYNKYSKTIHYDC